MLNIFRSENIIKSILESINDAILVTDDVGNIIYANNQIQDQLGYSPNELIGLNREQAISILVGVTPLEVKAFPIYDEFSNFCVELLVLKDLHEKLLNKITSLVNSSLSLKEVLSNTAFAVVEYLGLSSNAVFLLNEAKDELRLISHNAYPTPEDMAKIVYKIGDAPPWKAIKQSAPFYIENLRTDPTVSEHARKFHSDKSAIAFPLIYNSEVLGVIAFDATSVRNFSDKELSLFQNITDQVALAIKNAQIFSRVEHLSITDGLTGLYNYRFFEGRLREELERAKRNNANFGVLMLDVDNFKVYNDSYGHLCGDKVLKEIAKLLQKNVRSFDIVSRYGGEEFAIILLDCDRLTALNIAERVRLAIENYSFYGNKNQPEVNVTISIGLAMYPESKAVNKLISKADKALYIAKERGKNRVEVSECQ